MDKKDNSQVISFDAIITSDSDKSDNLLSFSSLSTPCLPASISLFLPSTLEIMLNIKLPKKIRSGCISLPSKQYNVGINEDVKVFLS